MSSPGAVGGGVEGVPLSFRQQRQAGGRRRLNDGRAVRQQPVGGGDGPSQRVVGGHLHPLPAQRRQQGVGGAFAAVGHG